MTQTYKVQVSMNQAHIVESGFVWKQGDFGFNIEIEVLDFDTTGATPQIIFRKSTGAVEATQISVAGNKFTYAIRGTELDTPGPCVCDLKLNDSTTKRVSTASFKYFVIPDTMDGLEQEASSYSDTIEQIVGGFDDEILNLNKGIQDINISLGIHKSFVFSSNNVQEFECIVGKKYIIKVLKGTVNIYGRQTESGSNTVTIAYNMTAEKEKIYTPTTATSYIYMQTTGGEASFSIGEYNSIAVLPYENNELIQAESYYSDARAVALYDYFIRNFSKNLYNPKSSILAGIDAVTGEKIRSSARFLSDFILVEPETLYTFCYFNSLNQSVLYNVTCSSYDENLNLIPGTNTTTSSITTAANVKYIRISGLVEKREILMVVKGEKPASNTYEVYKNFYDYIMNDLSIEGLSKWQASNKNTIIQTVDSFLLKSLTKNKYNYNTAKAGRVDPVSGEDVGNTNYFISEYIPVDSNTQYTFCYFSSKRQAFTKNCYCACYTKDKEVIPGSNTTISSILTPATCEYIRFSGDISYKEIMMVVEGSLPGNASYENFKSAESITNIKLNDLKNSRNCFINFQFDDALSNDSIIYNIFTAKNKKCGFALPSTVVENAGQVSRYLDYQTNGFEMLSHSTSKETPSTEDPLRESKTALENVGFKIRGWVTPASYLGPEYRKWLRKYYDFAYTVYYGEHSDTNIDPSNQPDESEYNLQRVSLESTQTYALLTNAVDNAIASGGFLTFYAHSTYIDAEGHGAFTTENLNNLIDYIKAKEENGYCKFLTPSECYDSYYKLKHDDLWLLLN